MHFSFSTVYTTILTSNILIVVIVCLLQNKKLLFKAGYSLIGIVSAMTILRLLLPFEFTFTQTVNLPEWLSFLITQFHYELFDIADYKITPWVLLFTIWILGTLCQTAYVIKGYVLTRQYISLHGNEVTDVTIYADTLLKACQNANCKFPFRIFELTGISTPMLYGFRRPCILLPDTLKLPKQQLYYVLSHEISHQMHGDMLLKYGVQILTLLYWWNPACYLLKQQVELLLEMRIDNSVTKIDEHSKQEYLQCLYNVAEHSVVHSDFPASHCVKFGAKSSGDLAKRFDILIHDTHMCEKGLNVAVLLITVLMFICSYLFIFEASYKSPEIENT